MAPSRDCDPSETALLLTNPNPNPNPNPDPNLNPNPNPQQVARLVEEEVPRPDHVIMNLPAIATEFLDALKLWVDYDNTETSSRQKVRGVTPTQSFFPLPFPSSCFFVPLGRAGHTCALLLLLERDGP